MTTAIATLTAAEADLLNQAEATIERGIRTFVEVGQALAMVRDNRLYRATFATFEEYADQRWNMSRPRAYELMNAAGLVSAIADTGLPAPANEGQARALARVPEEDRADVWRETLDRTEGKPTAAAVAAAWQERREPESEPDAIADIPLPFDEPEPNRCPECRMLAIHLPTCTRPVRMPWEQRRPDISDLVASRLDQVVEAQAKPAAPATPSEVRERDYQASSEAWSRNLAKCVYLLAGFSNLNGFVEKALKEWQPSQDIYPDKTTAERMRTAAAYLNAIAERWPA